MTIELGDEVPSNLLPVSDVRSPLLQVDSRVECVGAPLGMFYQARSFRDSRRIVLVGLANQKSILADYLDQVPDLPAQALVATLADASARHARGLGFAVPGLACAAIRMRNRRFEWARLGPVELVLRRCPSLCRRGGTLQLQGQETRTKSAIGSGSMPLRRGDVLMAWIGSPLPDAVLSSLPDKAPESGALMALGAEGCLAMIRRW